MQVDATGMHKKYVLGQVWTVWWEVRGCMIGPACGLMAWTPWLLQVRKTSQAALLVLLEQGLVEKGKDGFKRKKLK